MFEVDKFLYKPSFGDVHPCEPSNPHHESEHHCKPRYTMTEEVEHTARLMRETIDRLFKFEERCKAELATLSKNLMSDNVIFKNTMYEGYNTFLMEVKNEINVFENTMESDIKLFKQEIESNYSNLSESIDGRLSDFETKYEKEMTELNTSIQNQYNSFIESVNERIALNNENMSQAFAEYQRQLTTEMNTFQQNMAANYESFTESIGNSFHEFRQNWEETMTQRFAAQDGKISDAEAYMKTNLGATVTTLIGDMHANGDFTEIIEGEVFNDLEMRSKLEYHEANEEIGLATCAAYCRANNRIFYVPQGVALDVDETLDLTGVDVEVNGTLNITFNGVGVIVGDSSKFANHRKVYINAVTHTLYKDGDESVRVKGIMNGNIKLDNVPYIRLYADGDVDGVHAIGYSTFEIGTCRKLIIEDNADASGIGWINENIFHVNRITEELRIEGHTFAHDNNVFMKPCIEGAKLILKNCVRNKFYDVRGEGSFTANFDENTRYNYVLNNFHWTPINTHAGIEDNGRNNVFTNSVMESMENVPFYMMCRECIDVYNHYDELSLESDGTKPYNTRIAPLKAYSKLLLDAVIPVDGVSFIGMESDVKTFQLYVTPLDANMNVITTNPLDYTGGIKQNDNGTYQPTDEQYSAFIEIVDTNVKYLKITLDSAITAIQLYNYVTLYALCKKNKAHKTTRLMNCLKSLS